MPRLDAVLHFPCSSTPWPPIVPENHNACRILGWGGMRARVCGNYRGSACFTRSQASGNMRQGGLCRGLQRASALKEDALHNQRLCGVFGTFACTASHCLVLPLSSRPRISKPPERRLAKLAADSCRTHHRRWHSISKMLLLRLPRRALSHPLGLRHLGQAPMWRTRASMAGQTVGRLSNGRVAGHLNTCLSTPRDRPHPFKKILATKDGKDDPAIHLFLDLVSCLHRASVPSPQSQLWPALTTLVRRSRRVELASSIALLGVAEGPGQSQLHR